MKKTLVIGTLILILALTTLTIPKNVSANTTGDIVITDQTGQQTTLTHDQIVAMPSVTEEAILSCYGSQVADGQWTGVNLSQLLNLNTAEAVGGSIEFTAQDGYKISIPMATAVEPGVMLAYAFNSLPLQETYRLVVPEANGNTWIALVVSITVSDNAAPNVIGRNVDVFDAVQDFTKNTPQNTPSTTPVPTIKPILTPEPSISASTAPTIPPTNTTNLPTSQSTTQSTLPPETLYVAIAGIIAVLIVVGLVVVRQKKPKP